MYIGVQERVVQGEVWYAPAAPRELHGEPHPPPGQVQRQRPQFKVGSFRNFIGVSWLKCRPFWQWWGSGAAGSAGFWAFLIWIHYWEVWIRIRIRILTSLHPYILKVTGKESDSELDPDPGIRIRTKMSLIHNTAFSAKAASVLDHFLFIHFWRIRVPTIKYFRQFKKTCVFLLTCIGFST